MEIKSISGVRFASNTYILLSGGHAAVVDPSANVSDILAAVGDAEIKYILLTHGHYDHMLSLNILRMHTDAPVCIHKADTEHLANADLNASSLLTGKYLITRPAEKLLSDGDLLPLGDDVIKVISSPGHTEGSVLYECGDILVCGDTLFVYSYGRYDLPGGDPFKLSASLDILAERGDDPVIYPGHGKSCRLSKAEHIIFLRKFAK